MSLSNLIRRKSDPEAFATATPATFPTLEGGRGRTVASVATVAVAKSPQGQTAPPPKVGAGDTATASRWWLIHYPDRDPVEVACCPEATHAEAMLINQASSLQALFVRLSEKAMEQTHMPNLEGFMRLALRAQSQCRATLETLSAIKNPPVIYAKQVNQTTGPQQINNGTPLQARGYENEQSKQSGPELLPDARASQAASRVDPPLEALGEIDRAKVPRG